MVGGLPPGDKRHGTPNGYSHHKCRCDLCKQANRERHAQWQEQSGYVRKEVTRPRGPRIPYYF